MPTDFVGHIYKSADFDNPDDVAALVHVWIAEDLARGRCQACPD